MTTNDKATQMMISRVAYGIENGNVARMTRLTYAQAEQIARQAVAETNAKSLKAVRQWLDSKRVYYNF